MVNVFPNPLVGGVENVRAVNVNVDSVSVLGVNVAAYVLSLVNHKALFARLFRLVRKHAAKKSRASNKIIILFHL